MRTYSSEAERLRVRAKDTRALADTLTDPEAREIMMKLADDYERMARRAHDHRKAT